MTEIKEYVVFEQTYYSFLKEIGRYSTVEEALLNCPKDKTYGKEECHVYYYIGEDTRNV